MKTIYYFLIFCFLFLIVLFVLWPKKEAPITNPDQYVENLLTVVEKTLETDSKNASLKLEEALKYQNEINEETQLRLYKTAGYTYNYLQSYHLSLDYCFRYLELQNVMDSSKSHFAYNNIGSVYLTLGDTVNARKYLEISLARLNNAIKNDNLEIDNVESYLVYNNLAILEMKSGNYLRALQMLIQYKQHNMELNDTVGVLRSYINLANVYFYLKESNLAKSYLFKGIALSKEINSDADLAKLFYNLGNYYSSLENDSAYYYLHKSFELSDKHKLNNTKLVSAQALSDLYETCLNYKEANYYLRIAKSLSEENIDIESKKKIELLEFEHEQKIKQQNLLLNAKRRESFLIISSLLFLVIMVLVFFLYQIQKVKSKTRKVENELLIRKLAEKHKELTSNAIQNWQTSEIIETTHKELLQLNLKSDAATKKLLSQIISNLKKGNRAFNKEEFDKLFMETDDVFYKKLLNKYPTLTKNEIRLCAFAKMNLSVKEISSITQQSSNSILVARSRLRKKMGVEENYSLTVFLNQL